MRPVSGGRHAGDFELKPVALFEMMDASIESKQELQAMVRCANSHIIW